MTRKTEAAIDRLHAEQFALRDKVAALLAKMTPEEMDESLVRAGIITRSGRLTARYRPKRTAA